MTPSITIGTHGPGRWFEATLKMESPSEKNGREQRQDSAALKFGGDRRPRESSGPPLVEAAWCRRTAALVYPMHDGYRAKSQEAINWPRSTWNTRADAPSSFSRPSSTWVVVPKTCDLLAENKSNNARWFEASSSEGKSSRSQIDRGSPHALATLSAAICTRQTASFSCPREANPTDPYPPY